MRSFRPIALLLVVMLLAGCGASAPQGGPASPPAVSPDGRTEFDAFCAQLNAARRDNLTWTPVELAAFQAVAPTPGDLLTEEEVTALLAALENPPHIFGGVVSTEAAQSDVELFFARSSRPMAPITILAVTRCFCRCATVCCTSSRSRPNGVPVMWPSG